MNITDAIFEQAQRRPDHTAIEDGDRHITYGELETLIGNAAANLSASEVNPGDVVTILAGESAEHLVVICALARIGAVALGVSPWIPWNEIEPRLEGISSKFILTDDQSPDVKGQLSTELTKFCQPSSGVHDRYDASPEHPLVLSQSSGSTGRPKTFLRNHGQMEERYSRYVPNLGWNEDDRYLAMMSMTFDMGRTLCMGMLRMGATVVFNRANSPENLIASISEKNISYLHVPPMHVAVFLNFNTTPSLLFPHLRGLYVGTAAISPADRRRSRQLVARNTVVTYGCNELGLLSTLSPEDQDRYPEAVGRIVEGVEAQVVDDQDQPLPPNTLGQVRFRVTNPPVEYLNEPEMSAQTFRDGWFYPGDVATLNEEGILYYRGRADDVINNAGAKFYPLEVEQVLNEHSAVAEAAVMGWPIPPIGEIAVAAIVVRNPVSSQALQNHCADRLAGFKIPQAIIFVDELPKGAQGKVMKADLKPKIEREIERIRAQQR